jgi:hypothetical protein
MHWSLRLAVRVPILFPIWAVWALGAQAERLYEWLDDRIPDGVSTDAEGKWH